MRLRGITVQDVKVHLSLGCVQSVYHWLDGQSLPTLDNLYALSELLQVPMDMLVVGTRRYHPETEIQRGAERLLRYYRLLQDCMAAKISFRIRIIIPGTPLPDRGSRGFLFGG